MTSDPFLFLDKVREKRASNLKNHNNIIKASLHQIYYIGTYNIILGKSLKLL